MEKHDSYDDKRRVVALSSGLKFAKEKVTFIDIDYYDPKVKTLFMEKIKMRVADAPSSFRLPSMEDSTIQSFLKLVVSTYFKN